MPNGDDVTGVDRFNEYSGRLSINVFRDERSFILPIFPVCQTLQYLFLTYLAYFWWAGLDRLAGRIWPAGRHLGTPGLGRIEKKTACSVFIFNVGPRARLHYLKKSMEYGLFDCLEATCCFYCEMQITVLLLIPKLLLHSGSLL